MHPSTAESLAHQAAHQAAMASIYGDYNSYLTTYKAVLTEVYNALISIEGKQSNG
jgi:hypothetical protein